MKKGVKILVFTGIMGATESRAGASGLDWGIKAFLKGMKFIEIE